MDKQSASTNTGDWQAIAEVPFNARLFHCGITDPNLKNRFRITRHMVSGKTPTLGFTLVVAAQINGATKPVYVQINDVPAFAAAARIAADEWAKKCARYRFTDGPIEQPDPIKTALGRPLEAAAASDLVEDDYVPTEEDAITNSGQSTASQSAMVAAFIDDYSEESATSTAAAATTATTGTAASRKTATAQQEGPQAKQRKIGQ